MGSFTFSVIIPHYNIPSLLQRLLKSIPYRRDLQIIVVDDCSSNIQELENIIKGFPKVELYSTKDRGGGGKARNVGLNHAKGKYVIFADADDYFESDFNNILDEYSKKKFDIAFFRGCSKDPERDIITHRTDHLNEYIRKFQSGEDPNGNNLRFLFGEPWCKIIRNDLIKENQIKFDEINIHNDTKFAYLIGFYAKTIEVDDRTLYCVTSRANSVSRAISDDRIITRIKVFGEAEIFLKKNNIEVFSLEHYNQLTRLIAHGRIKLFKKGVRLINSLGIGKKDIYLRCCKTFLKIVSKRFSFSISAI